MGITVSRHCGMRPIDKRENQQWLDLFDPTCVRDMLNESLEIRHMLTDLTEGRVCLNSSSSPLEVARTGCNPRLKGDRCRSLRNCATA